MIIKTKLLKLNNFHYGMLRKEFFKYGNFQIKLNKVNGYKFKRKENFK